jgi:hypothetical protein
MPPDTYAVEPDAQVRAVRMSFISILEKCRSFVEEVAECEAECGAMSIIEIERHISYLREREQELRRAVQ